MNIAIFGTKREAIYLYNQIKENNLGKIIIFIDNDKSKCGQLIDGIEIISYDKFQENSEIIDAVIIAMRGSNSRLEVMNQLECCRVKKGFFLFSYFDYKKKVSNIDDAIFWLNERIVMPYLEYNVTYSCNLKCKGCTHFSNLVGDEEFADFDSFKNDIDQVTKHVDIAELRLLGGEPLLHKELKKFVAYARESCPHADIFVVTNGLLIPQISDDLLECMAECNVGFHISNYIPTSKMIERISEHLKMFDVKYFIEDNIINEFGKTLDMKGTSNPFMAQKACISLGCRNLKDGRIYKCPFEALIDIFAKKYCFDEVLKINKGFNIYDNSNDWEIVLKKMLESPVELCKFCSESCEMFKWEVRTNPEKNDWIVSKYV